MNTRMHSHAVGRSKVCFAAPGGCEISGRRSWSLQAGVGEVEAGEATEKAPCIALTMELTMDAKPFTCEGEEGEEEDEEKRKW